MVSAAAGSVGKGVMQMEHEALGLGVVGVRTLAMSASRVRDADFSAARSSGNASMLTAASRRLRAGVGAGVEELGSGALESEDIFVTTMEVDDRQG